MSCDYDHVTVMWLWSCDCHVTMIMWLTCGYDYVHDWPVTPDHVTVMWLWMIMWLHDMWLWLCDWHVAMITVCAWLSCDSWSCDWHVLLFMYIKPDTNHFHPAIYSCHPPSGHLFMPSGHLFMPSAIRPLIHAIQSFIPAIRPFIHAIRHPATYSWCHPSTNPIQPAILAIVKLLTHNVLLIQKWLTKSI